MSAIVVVKVGGSLLDWSALPQRLSAYLARRRGDRLVLVAGGGRAADLVRELDKEVSLGDEHAHALALRAMDLTARLLQALVPGLVLVEHPEDLPLAWQTQRTPVLAPRLFLEGDDRDAREPLPHSWAVTSDSIAARLAEQLGAAELVLLKSAPLPAGVDRENAAARGLVDSYFPTAARALRKVVYINLREETEAAPQELT